MQQWHHNPVGAVQGSEKPLPYHKPLWYLFHLLEKYTQHSKNGLVYFVTVQGQQIILDFS